MKHEPHIKIVHRLFLKLTIFVFTVITLDFFDSLSIFFFLCSGGSLHILSRMQTNFFFLCLECFFFFSACTHSDLSYYTNAESRSDTNTHTQIYTHLIYIVLFEDFCIIEDVNYLLSSSLFCVFFYRNEYYSVPIYNSIRIKSFYLYSSSKYDIKPTFSNWICLLLVYMYVCSFLSLFALLSLSC